LADFVMWLLKLIASIPSAIVRGRRTRRIDATGNAVERWCTEVGWRYLANGSPDMLNPFAGAPFRRGTSRELRHVLTGRDRGRPAMVVELGYYYTDGGLGDASSMLGDELSQMRDNPGGTCSIAIIELPAALPRLQVTREGLLSGAAEKVGLRDLQLESSQFNATFKIGCDVPRFAYDVLHPRMMDWLLDDPRSKEMGFRIDGPNLVVWRAGWLDDRSGLVGLVGFASDLVDRLPGFVFDNGQRQGSAIPLSAIKVVGRWGY
jgi:hypothetical protein